MANTLLQVDNLVTTFRTAEGNLPAVRGISFSVQKGETLCIVGESGCGKSITSLSIMQLLPSNGSITSGQVLLENENLANKTADQMRKIRGNKVSMIFQEPMTALNPVLTIGYQIREPLMLHQGLSKKEALQKGIALLTEVGIPYPEKRLKQYPHELSGGMRQRVMIAIALACKPKLLIADEPTTALDVTIQSQILDLINDLKDELDMGVIMVTHDMGVVAEMADKVLIMYAGEKVEEGDVYSIFANPMHPYTRGLLGSVPNIDDPDFVLEPIKGTLPSLSEQIDGCRFHPRCPFATDHCKQYSPIETKISDSHSVRCWLVEGEKHD